MTPEPLFVGGFVGRGLSVRCRPEHTLTFPCAGNLEAREDTLAFWVFPVGWDPNRALAGSRSRSG